MSCSVKYRAEICGFFVFLIVLIVQFIKEKNWEYRFFIDFEGNLNDTAVMGALRGIMEEVSYFKILGNY